MEKPVNPLVSGRVQIVSTEHVMVLTRIVTIPDSIASRLRLATET